MRLVRRDIKPSDRAFIAASWSQTCRRPPEASLLTRAAWRTALWSSIPDILDRPGVRVLVVADAEITDGVADLVGYLVWLPVASEPLPIVFYCFVKPDYRRSGIARDLFRAARIDPALPFPFVCLTQTAATLREVGKLTATWRPDLGRDLNPSPSKDHGTHHPEED